MLVSHRHRFVFTKTVKTASTSIEAFFEPFCLPERAAGSVAHQRDEYEGPEGIVGYRGSSPTGRVWYNHMPASRIRELLGEETWNSYFKFSVVRNPFDKMVSAFAMYDRRQRDRTRWQKLRALLRRMGGRPRCIDRVVGITPPERFRSWIANGGAFLDRDKYMIDDRLCVDYLIRFEDLASGVREVCARLGLPFAPASLPVLKTGMRDRGIPVPDYYDESARRAIERLYDFELAHLGYSFPDATMP